MKNGSTTSGEARLECLVSGCGCSRKSDGMFSEWVCHKHWKLVPPQFKKAHVAAKRDVRRISRWPNSEANQIALTMAFEREFQAWTLCKESLAANENMPPDLQGFLTEMGM